LKSFGFDDPIHGKPTANDTQPNPTNTEYTYTPLDTVPTVPTVPASTKSRTVESGIVPTVPKSIHTNEDKDPPGNILERHPPKTVNPIISVEYFFSNDMPLDAHSFEESPCYPIIGSKPGEIPTDTVYYCKLHPELGSTFLTAIEIHCREKEPDIHKAKILFAGVIATATTAEHDITQQHGQGESA
jgi:hypothetical protein